eukprot:maker-scaffold261_size233860-snap-gene-1.30 protein:Tk10693 transcript:maker-scaffold261_size233860-snap-gene-1.30-mRNA-1 annotation:"membrane protein"
MRIKYLVFLVITSGVLASILEVESRRFGGGVGRRPSRPTRRRPTRTSTNTNRQARPGATGSYTRRNAGYGTYRTQRLPLPRTSLYSRNYGNFNGRRSSSFNGFGLGMGAGLLIGFRFGVLSRPIGYGRPAYNYGYIHEHRNYDMERPFTCATTNVTEYLKTRGANQELNIDEGEKRCATSEDVCYGKITVLEANMTLADSSEKEGFEVHIEKGCGVASKISEDFKAGPKYDSKRQCWSNLVETQQSGGNVSAESIVPEKLIEVLGLKGKSIAQGSVS